MAAWKMFSSLSRPAKDILLQRSPNCPNPLRFRFSPTATRPFSAKSESDHLPHWATEYRRLLGIDDAPVITRCIFTPWRPPREGEIKINFHNGRLEDHHDDTRTVLMAAVARNSSDDILGVSAASKKLKRVNMLGGQLYALKAAANLAKKLNSTGTHDGPVVFESDYLVLPRCFREPKEMQREMPRDEDLEEFSRMCPIYCSRRDKSDHHPHWAAEYRRRLGIDDARVILHPFFSNWRPPRPGEIKINLFPVLGDDHFRTIRVETEAEPCDDGRVTAVARNSSGDVLGVTTGFFQNLKHVTELKVHLYALKAAANLADALKSAGMHDGPVVYETRSVLVARFFHDDCEGDREEVLRRTMPGDDDLEELGRSCPAYCGRARRLSKISPVSLDILFIMQERDKALAGL